MINSIAQQLGTNKPKVTIVREEISKQRKQTTSSAYNLKSSMQIKGSKHVATIENFPKIPQTTNEWSSDEEIDLGKESSEEEDIVEIEGAEKVTKPILRQNENSTESSQLPEQEIIDLEETQAKYDAIFGKGDIDLGVTKSSSKILERIQESLNTNSGKYLFLFLIHVTKTHAPMRPYCSCS